LTKVDLYAPSRVRDMNLDLDDIGKFVALGGTFHSHLDEKKRTYRWPDIWVVPSEGMVDEDEPIQIPERVQQVKPGSELTAVIGEDLWQPTEAEAWDAIEGFTISNDVTAVGDWPGWSDPNHEMITGVGYKILPTFSPIRGTVTPKKSKDAYDDLDVKVYVDGNLSVDGSTELMAFSIPELISFASHVVRLEQNDVVALGDPGDPDILLDDADSVTCEIETVGSLENPVERL